MRGASLAVLVFGLIYTEHHALLAPTQGRALVAQSFEKEAHAAAAPPTILPGGCNISGGSGESRGRGAAASPLSIDLTAKGFPGFEKHVVGKLEMQMRQSLPCKGGVLPRLRDTLDQGAGNLYAASECESCGPTVADNSMVAGGAAITEATLSPEARQGTGQARTRQRSRGQGQRQSKRCLGASTTAALARYIAGGTSGPGDRYPQEGPPGADPAEPGQSSVGSVAWSLGVFYLGVATGGPATYQQPAGEQLANADTCDAQGGSRAVQVSASSAESSSTTSELPPCMAFVHLTVGEPVGDSDQRAGPGLGGFRQERGPLGSGRAAGDTGFGQNGRSRSWATRCQREGARRAGGDGRHGDRNRDQASRVNRGIAALRQTDGGGAQRDEIYGGGAAQKEQKGRFANSEKGRQHRDRGYCGRRHGRRGQAWQRLWSAWANAVSTWSASSEASPWCGSYIGLTTMCEPISYRQFCAEAGLYDVEEDETFVGPIAASMLGCMRAFGLATEEVLGHPVHLVWEDPREDDCRCPAPADYDRALLRARVQCGLQAPRLPCVPKKWALVWPIGRSLAGVGPPGDSQFCSGQAFHDPGLCMGKRPVDYDAAWVEQQDEVPGSDDSSGPCHVTRSNLYIAARDACLQRRRIALKVCFAEAEPALAFNKWARQFNQLSACISPSTTASVIDAPSQPVQHCLACTASAFHLQAHHKQQPLCPAVDALSQPVQPYVVSTAMAFHSMAACAPQLQPRHETCCAAKPEARFPGKPIFHAVDTPSQLVQPCRARTAPTLQPGEHNQCQICVPLKELPGAPAHRKPPSDIQRIVAEALPLFSTSFQGPRLYEAVQESVTMAAATGDADGPSRFSVFDTTFHARSRIRGDRWSIMDCVADAVASAGTRTKAVQVIDTPMPSLPQPQITLTAADTDRHVFALPLDLREFGLFVYTFAAAPGSTVQDVIDQLHTAQQGRRSILSAGLNPHELRFRDAKGRVFDALSEPVTDHEWLQLVGLHATDLCRAGASTTPTTTAMQSQPPRLLGFELELQPAHIPRALSGTDFTPIYIATEPGAHMPLGHMCLFEGLDAKIKKETPFVMLTKDFPPVRLVGSTAWSALDFCAMAARQFEQPPRHAQMLMTPLAGVPVPQIIITEQGQGDEGDIIPVDLRPFGGEIIPIPLRPGATLRHILDRALQSQPTLHERLTEPWNTDRLYVQDSQGHIYDQLPQNVRALEWLVVHARCESAPPQPLGSFQAPPPMWPLQCTSTSTTTTAMQPQVPMVSFVIVGAGVTVRSTVQPMQDVDVRATLAELFRGLIGLGRLRQSFQLQLSPVMPRTTDRGHFVIPLLVVPQPVTDHVTVLVDPGSEGLQLHSMTLPFRDVSRGRPGGRSKAGRHGCLYQWDASSCT